MTPAPLAGLLGGSPVSEAVSAVQQLECGDVVVAVGTQDRLRHLHGLLDA